jgi:ubiquinone/menaquinone biosynthesis C-methylase UbiE
MPHEVFEREAAAYDAWYDTALGRAVLRDELAALRPLLTGLPRPWLEIGVGSGRFAAALGARVGVDPATSALVIARRRGVRVVRGVGELLPLGESVFGAVLLTTTLEFVADPVAVLREGRRVLRPAGALVLGTIPAEGAWAAHYRTLARQGDPYFRRARFFRREELDRVLDAAGMRRTRLRTALAWPPAGALPTAAAASEGDNPRAGFRAVRAERGRRT